MSIRDLISPQAFIQGGGRCGKLMRFMDWRKSPLGSPENWPAALNTITDTCLHANLPMIVWWGEKSVMLYNDASRRILGPRHPEPMGQPAYDVLPEVQKGAQQVFHTGEAITSELTLMISHNGKKQEAYFSVYHCPIHSQKGKPQGVFTTLVDTTRTIVERRLTDNLRRLSKALTCADSRAMVYQLTANVFDENQYDFPFLFIYDLIDNQAILKSPPPPAFYRDAAPEIIDQNTNGGLWPLKKALSEDRHLLIEFESRVRKMLPRGKWNEAPDRALMFPIRSADKRSADAIMIFGVNPCCSSNDLVMDFLTQFVEQITDRLASIENQRKLMDVARDQSAQAARQLEHLRHISSHELQEPLRKIRTFAYLVNQSLKNEPEVTTHLEKIDDAAAQMSLLIHNVTNHPALAVNSDRLEQVSLTSCLESAIHELREDIARKNAVIKYKPLPDVRGSQKQLVVLFKTLLEMSLRFSDGPPLVALEFHHICLMRNAMMRNYLELIYTDNRMAIDHGPHNKTLVVVDRADNITFAGNAVALTLCKRIVENHHGSLEVSSTVHHKTLIRIMMPIEDE